MPIKPENKARYPKDWPAIRTAILERAQHRCEWPGCEVPNYGVGFWKKDDFYIVNDECRSYAQARQWLADECFSRYGDEVPDRKFIVIVLTVAHLDHQPENCAPENLRAWCQRHHLAYDHRHHIGNAWATRRAKMGNFELELAAPATSGGSTG